MDNQTVTSFITNFVNGNYDASDINTQIDAGWFDWFCKDSSLAKRTQTLGKKVIQISKGNKFNNDEHYVFFKNNCPCSGGTYDSFSICDMEEGNVIFHIASPNSRSNNWEVYGKLNNFEEAIIEGSWLEVKKWFLEA